MQRIGIVAQEQPETRVAATPQTVGRLISLGYDIAVEKGAGVAASFPDEAFVAAGARIVERDAAWAAPIVLTVNAPGVTELDLLSEGAAVIGLLAPAQHPDYVAELAGRTITALALDAVPRISRAQSMDVLSSMANIAGYRAVVEAAHSFGRFFTGQVTAAGKVPPAKVLVAGAGVAGLAAIGAASSLGAIVRATDPRPEVADQVASIGGEYLAVDPAQNGAGQDGAGQEKSSDGYARATSADYDRAAEELYASQAKDVDIIITTALIPGREAPRLLTAEHVAAMKTGSVIVDMAAAHGGNVEGSVAGEIVVVDGVTIIGYTDLAGRLPAQASQLYGTNLVNLLKLLTPEKDGELTLDMDDPVQRGITVVRAGELMWPPPAVQVSAAPAPPSGAAAGNGRVDAEAPAPKKERAPLGQTAKIALVAAGALALIGLTAIAPPQLALNLTVFYLAVVIGFYVIGNVHHALHTPLMSVTNAISGIVVVGALLQISIEDALAIRILAVAAIFVASINIFGGFAMTRRMLGMFVKGEAR